MNSKVKCLILDDELPGLTYLKMLCEELDFAEVERCFSSPELFLREYHHLDYDVCLLDINMPGMSGIEVAQFLKNKPVIFISAHPEYAINAFELDAVDFIKKPVTKERLEKALLKVKNNLSAAVPAKNYFVWNTNIGKSTIYFDEIIYITTSDIDRRDKTLLLANDNALTLKNITLDKLLEYLPKNNFIQINKSDIVHRRSIQAYTADDVILKLKRSAQIQLTLSIGDSFKKEFLHWVK